MEHFGLYLHLTILRTDGLVDPRVNGAMLQKQYANPRSSNLGEYKQSI